MAPRVYWMGSFGPFPFNDTNTFIDGSPHRMATDRAPAANDDVVRFQDIGGVVGGIIQIVATLTINDPIELNTLNGFANGALAMVAQTAGAALDEMTLYAWDSNPGAILEDPPYLVNGAGGSMWIAVGGSFHYEGERFGDSTNYLAIAADGTLTFAGTARVMASLQIDISVPKRPIANPPAEGTEDGFPTLDFDDGTDESIYLSFHLPHDYAAAGGVEVHFDFFVDTAPVGAANAGWGIEYKKVSHGDNFTFLAGTTTLEAPTAITTGTPANDKKIHVAAGLALTTAGWVLGDSIYCRLYRDTGVAGDFTGDIRMIGQIHIEYLIDKLGD